MTSPDLIVPVQLGERSYDIRIGQSNLQHTGPQLTAWCRSADGQALRTCIVADSHVMATHGETVRNSLVESGIQAVVATVPSGETSKSFEQLQALYDLLVEMPADRKTVVVAIGGGVVGDLAGFAAASYARGLRFIQIPTTLLAMVDSSVGGKTGINHPKGKNLIGAFHQPNGVLIDTDTLNTLPDREYRSGLAEVVKYGIILDAEFFTWLESHVDNLNRRDPSALRHVVARSCQLKADVVRQDEHETTGQRAMLNYGHTYAHAFEALAGYGALLHGEAVSIGMVCASRLAERLNRITADDTQRQRDLLTALHLPTAVPDDLVTRHDEIIRCMMLDKKTEGNSLRFVLPTCIGHVETVRGIEATVAISCLR